MLNHFKSDLYQLNFYQNYAHLEMFSNRNVDVPIVKSIIKQLKHFFERRPFVLISERKSVYKVDPSAFSLKMKNLKGLAVVSHLESVRENAMVEQQYFDSSFAFFEDMKEAHDWASSYFR